MNVVTECSTNYNSDFINCVHARSMRTNLSPISILPSDKYGMYFKSKYVSQILYVPEQLLYSVP